MSRQHLLSAVFKAATASASDALKTSNVHSEIVASLSPSNNVRAHPTQPSCLCWQDPIHVNTHNHRQIAEAYRRFGISPSTKDLLIIKVVKDGALSAQQISDHLTTHVEGDWLPATDDNISAATDMTKVSKYYKLNGLNWITAIKDAERKKREMEMVILGTMALRGV